MLSKNWANLQAALHPKRKAETIEVKTAPKQRRKRVKTKALDRMNGVRICGVSKVPLSQLACVQLEIARCGAVESLGKHFAQVCSKHLKSRKPWMHFENWLWALRNEQGGDPVLPRGSYEPELQRKLESAGASSEIAGQVCAELAQVASLLAKQLTETNSRQRKEKAVCSVSGDHVELTLGDYSLPLPSHRYEKLCYLLQLHGVTGEPVVGAVLSCVARYHAMAGCHPRAGGMQAAIPPAVFDVLEQEFGVSMECFASPLNCNWPTFCSAFPDVDRPFGSLGSFFDFAPPSTPLSLEANPPFDARIVTRMAAHMEHLLSSAKAALSFTVIIPCWEQAEEPLRVAAWTGLLNSRFCRLHKQLPQADHAFCEGSQSAQYHVANSDTSVFFLQNTAGSSLWTPTPARVARLQQAFRLRKS